MRRYLPIGEVCAQFRKTVRPFNGIKTFYHHWDHQTVPFSNRSRVVVVDEKPYSLTIFGHLDQRDCSFGLIGWRALDYHDGPPLSHLLGHDSLFITAHSVRMLVLRNSALLEGTVVFRSIYFAYFATPHESEVLEQFNNISRIRLAFLAEIDLVLSICQWFRAGRKGSCLYFHYGHWSR